MECLTFIAYAITATLLALALTASATFTLRRAEQVVGGMREMGVPDSWFPRLATLKAAGALGLIGGLWFAPLGTAAATGVILYFIGALITHLRAKDYALAPAAVLTLIAVAALALRIASA
ncbi:DoxX family protein [Streptomyces sp. G-G2]|uniref:DoxX family protein n=1 Tax=Streptomyces sp. G-G2 TaxID=3046201 RepID=UPI0024B9B0D5|nr:DoxX family protein [Streptomyces sp. G-G2]MDJ0383852.1 DoxX family protein [Streptomyces sp. G-G2]